MIFERAFLTDGYKTLFDNASVAIREEDFSAAGRYITGGLEAENLSLRELIKRSPGELMQAARGT
jgi:hypothetical protein